MDLEVGAQASHTMVVGDGDTAISLGSGDVPVLGTPRLVAWCEAATVQAVAAGLEPGTTSVGTNVNISHRAPTRVGAQVTVSATLEAVDRRALRFAVTATEGDKLVGDGTVDRVVVDIERFLG